MSSKTVEISVSGQLLRLNCPDDQQDNLRKAAKNLDLRILEMKEKTGILQLDRVLSIVALNLSYELIQEQQKVQRIEDVVTQRIQQLGSSLEEILVQKSSD
ncbi:cell division protein ZapA [Bisgaardia hudsonensis]|uniref:Cell division protein ZapA n=1 Tax=Bisgaardia hudsonensis TaxID=109472 RepID=A0A4R2N004_9PAST|nr:cell division protein ZapA [Bisgaardia hudsonensis]QLB12307.1 cell division protein ZapA [Bisgaardia hudsonensis]TCP12353.1 cell division protein ZapA [Bisgaardia hudsonensis]